jgi:hypothetical protein
VDISGMADGALTGIESLRAAYVAAGGDCSEWAGASPFEGGSSSGDCSSTNLLALFTSSDPVPTEATRLARVAADLGSSGGILYGPNWIVNADDSAKVAGGMGGTLIKYGPTN